MRSNSFISSSFSPCPPAHSWASTFFYEKEEMFPTPVKLRKKDWLYLDVIEDLVSDKCMFCPEIWDNCTASTPKESLSKIWEIACL